MGSEVVRDRQRYFEPDTEGENLKGDTVTSSVAELREGASTDAPLLAQMVDKHHKGMAPASSDVSPREHAGRWLPPLVCGIRPLPPTQY
jgi:hypothetical protein